MVRLIPAALEKRYEAASARITEANNRPYSSDDAVRVASQQDLLEAWDELAVVYAEAMKLPTLGTGLLWSALYDAQSYARRRRFAIEHEAKTLGGGS